MSTSTPYKRRSTTRSRRGTAISSHRHLSATTPTGSDGTDMAAVAATTTSHVSSKRMALSSSRTASRSCSPSPPLPPTSHDTSTSVVVGFTMDGLTTEGSFPTSIEFVHSLMLQVAQLRALLAQVNYAVAMGDMSSLGLDKYVKKQATSGTDVRFDVDACAPRISLCCVCNSNYSECMCPAGHLCMCTFCAGLVQTHLHKCPLCRIPMTSPESAPQRIYT